MKKINLIIMLFVLLITSNLLASCTRSGLNTTSEHLPSLETARTEMINFLSLLNQENYSEAARNYGGDLEILRGYNPDIDPEDVALLLEFGCKFNGIQCMRLKSVVSEEQVDETNFVFIIEYVTNHGDLFELGPCCGETEKDMPPISKFQINVEYADDAYQILDLPPYVP